MILDQFCIKGKVALVTGGTKGMGRAMAQALAEAGADVAVASRRPESEVEEHIKSMGRRYVHVPADLTKRDNASALIPEVEKSLGMIDILVNNAGIIRRSPAEAYSQSDWDATLEIDLSAAFVLSQAAAKGMLEKGMGKIINVCSVLSFQGGVNVPAYAAAKHGLAGLTKALASEWAGKGVNVNAIAPGYIATELTEALQQNQERSMELMARTPVSRWGQPDDLGGAVVFLASPASDFLHGVILPVDGGWMAR